MGLLYEYSKTDNEYFHRPAKPEHEPAAQDDTPTDDIQAAKETAAETPRLRGLDILIMVVVGFGVLFAGAFVMALVLVINDPTLLETQDPSLIAEQLMQYPLIQLVSYAILMTLSFWGIWAYVAFRLKGNWQKMGLRPAADTVWLWRSAALGLAAAPVFMVITLGLDLITGGIPSATSSGAAALRENLSPAFFLLLLVLFGFIIPTTEELLFRGVLYEWMRSRWGPWPSIFINGWLYGILNIAAASFLTGALLGGVMAALYERTGSVWTVVIAHCVHNIVTLGLIIAASILFF